MKKLITTLSTLALTAVVVNAQVQETPATLYLIKGGNPQGVIRGSRPGSITFAPSGGSNTQVNLTQIKGTGLDKAIRLEARNEALAPARAAFSKKEYLEAAKLFGQVADAYGLILNIPQNFASEAKFFQLESLRRLGRFDVLPKMLDTPSGKSLDSMLSERYKKSLTMIRLWSTYGSNDMGKLEEDLKMYQQIVAGDAKLLPAPSFKPLPLSDLVQVAFLRAKVYDAKGESAKALQDYQRVFSMSYANEPYLAKQAMGAAMVIMSKNPALESGSDKAKAAASKEIQSVAYFFKKRFPDTNMPAQFAEYSNRPDIQAVMAPSEDVTRTKVAQDTPAEGEEAPAEGGEKPAEEKKGKGKKGK